MKKFDVPNLEMSLVEQAFRLDEICSLMGELHREKNWLKANLSKIAIGSIIHGGGVFDLQVKEGGDVVRCPVVSSFVEQNSEF